MISATVAGSHRFGTVRRHGYDPAEVDAVVERLTDALSTCQEKVAHLESRLEDSEVSAAAITRTLAVVENTRSGMLDEARAEAEEVIAKAKAEADDITHLADQLGAEVSARRDAILTEAFEEADTIIAEATIKAAEGEYRSARAAELLMADATDRATTLTTEATTFARNKELGMAWAMRATTEKAERMIADAEQQAARIVRDAEFEHERLTAKLGGLRDALLDLRTAAAVLADDTIERARIIDLSAVEASRIQIAPETITLVEAVTEEPEEPIQDDEFEADTFYQRRGRTLRERIEIARSMP